VTPVDEELWFDSDGGDAEAEAKAAQSMAAMVGRILGAKPFPVAAQRLAELTRAPNARIDQAVRILESDPALSARLLRLVNSAGYALRLRCTSVRHAAALVGTRRLHQVATTAAVLDLFDSKSETAIRVLEHAASVGALSRYLAVHVGLPRDELFTCGFLHDIGKLMLLDTEGESYTELLDACGEVSDEVHLFERERYGFDHAVLGAHVLSAWNIPEPIPKVVAWHHRPARAYRQGGQIASMVSTTRLADMLSHALLEEATPELIARIAQSEAATYLEVSEVQLATMWGELQALREQCSARSRGAEATASLVPRQEALGASSGRAPSSSGTPRSLPKHFPCIVCHNPSFGNTCPRCAGYVCTVHQIGPNDWCAQCLHEYNDTVVGARMSLRFKTMAGAAIVGLASAAVIGVAAGGAESAMELTLAPLLLTATAVIVCVVGWRWYLRYRFMRVQPRHRRPQTEPREAPASAEPAATESNAALPESASFPIQSLVPDPSFAVAPTIPLGAELVALASRRPSPGTNSEAPSAFELAAAVAPMELSAFEFAAAIGPTNPPAPPGPSIVPLPSITVTERPPAPIDSLAPVAALPPVDSLPPESIGDMMPTNYPPVHAGAAPVVTAESLPAGALLSLPAEAVWPQSIPGEAPVFYSLPAEALVSEPPAAQALPEPEPEAEPIVAASIVAEPQLESAPASEPAPIEDTAEPELRSSVPESATLELGHAFQSIGPIERAESTLVALTNTPLRGAGQRCRPQRHVNACSPAPFQPLGIVRALPHELDSDEHRAGSAAVA
jgi:putative nucleotidyltransferase with HDIG domain